MPRARWTRARGSNGRQVPPVDQATLSSLYAYLKDRGGWLAGCKTVDQELSEVRKLRYALAELERSLADSIIAGSNPELLWPLYVERIEELLKTAGAKGETPAELRKRSRRWYPALTTQAASEWLDHLIASGWLTVVEKKSAGSPGRPVRRCYVTSQLLENQGKLGWPRLSAEFSGSQGMHPRSRVDHDDQELPA